MFTARRPASTLTLAAAVVFALAACGGDDDGAGSAEPTAEPTAEAPSGEGNGNDGNGGDVAAADAAAPGEDASGGESTLLADELHPLELPEPGTAVVRLAGETYEFGTLEICEILETAPGNFRFVAIGNDELTDGTRTRFDVSRYIIEPETLMRGDWHERDFLQLTVEQEPGDGMYSNAIHDVTRDEPGGPVSGDGDVMPVIRVVDDGAVLAATAIADVSHPSFTREFDRAGEGLAEFAVNCG
jgi:hypothetical protein